MAEKMIDAETGGLAVDITAYDADPATEARHTGPLSGRLAVVTGGSGRVGRSIALRLAAEGARVCVVGRDLVRLRSAVGEGGRSSAMLYLQCDLGSAKEIDGLSDFIDRFDRPIDLLVHAAGVTVAGDVASGDVADLDEQYLVNVRAPFLVTQKLLPKLRAGGGHVIFVRPTPDGPGTATMQGITSAASAALSAGLAREEAEHGISVAAVECATGDVPLSGDVVADAVVYAVTVASRAQDVEIVDIRLRSRSLG